MHIHLHCMHMHVHLLCLHMHTISQNNNSTKTLLLSFCIMIHCQFQVFQRFSGSKLILKPVETLLATNKIYTNQNTSPTRSCSLKKYIIYIHTYMNACIYIYRLCHRPNAILFFETVYVLSSLSIFVYIYIHNFFTYTPWHTCT
jgi:hypothetical protein